MRKLLKGIHLVALVLPHLIWDYFTWILPCSRHPERYPISTRYQKARKLVLWILRVCHFNLQTRGEIVHPGTQLYVSNHLSVLDPLVLIALSDEPVSFIAKKEARKIPVAGKLIKAIDGLFLDRDDPFQAVKLFRIAKKNMADSGMSYAIFPEGTRQKQPYLGEVLPFHPGSFKLAQMAKCPITAYVSYGSFHFVDEKPGRNFPLTLQMLRRYETDEVMGKPTTELASGCEGLFNKALPVLVEEDQAYFEQGKNRAKAPKWWDNLLIQEKK